MPQPRFLGIEHPSKVKPVRDQWHTDGESLDAQVARAAKAKLKSLATLKTRIKASPSPRGLGRAGSLAQEPHARLRRNPNLFRFYLADRWRGYYAWIGGSGGVCAWVLYL